MRKKPVRIHGIFFKITDQTRKKTVRALFFKWIEGHKQKIRENWAKKVQKSSWRRSVKPLALQFPCTLVLPSFSWWAPHQAVEVDEGFADAHCSCSSSSQIPPWFHLSMLSFKTDFHLVNEVGKASQYNDPGQHSDLPPRPLWGPLPSLPKMVSYVLFIHHISTLFFYILCAYLAVIYDF